MAPNPLVKIRKNFQNSTDSENLADCLLTATFLSSNEPTIACFSALFSLFTRVPPIRVQTPKNLKGEKFALVREKKCFLVLWNCARTCNFLTAVKCDENLFPEFPKWQKSQNERNPMCDCEKDLMQKRFWKLRSACKTFAFLCQDYLH